MQMLTKYVPTALFRQERLAKLPGPMPIVATAFDKYSIEPMQHKSKHMQSNAV